MFNVNFSLKLYRFVGFPARMLFRSLFTDIFFPFLLFGDLPVFHWIIFFFVRFLYPFRRHDRRRRCRRRRCSHVLNHGFWLHFMLIWLWTRVSPNENAINGETVWTQNARAGIARLRWRWKRKQRKTTKTTMMMTKTPNEYAKRFARHKFHGAH